MADHMTSEQKARRALSDAGFIGATEADISVLTDLAQAGMRFHGPHVEAATMPVANLVHALRGLAARLSGMAAVPDGWKLVPIEATDPMLVVLSGGKCVFGGVLSEGYKRFVRNEWARILAAAPEAPGHGK